MYSRGSGAQTFGYDERSGDRLNEILEILLGLGFALALLAWVCLALDIRGVQRRMEIVAQPALLPTEQDHLDPAMQQLLDQVTPDLMAQGYRRAIGAHAPHFPPGSTWTQLLFCNPEDPTRISIVCLSSSQSAHVDILLATQFEDGVVSTAVRDRARSEPDPGPKADLTNIDIAQLIELHRRRVQEQHPLPGKPQRVPAEGEEWEWLCGRAAAIADGFLTRGYVRRPDGRAYVPSRKLAFAVLRQTWRNRCRKLLGRKVPRGFDVSIPSSSDGPDATSPKA